MHHVPRIMAALLAISIVTGCKKKEAAPGADPGAAAPGPAAPAQPAPPADPPLTAAFFGKAVAPPGPLAQLAIGQPEEEARKAAPALFEAGSRAFHTTSTTGVKGVLSYLVWVDHRQKVVRLSAELAGTSKPAELLAQAWGPGQDAKEETDRARTCWFDAATGWRACLDARMGADRMLNVDRFLPTSALLGEGADTIGFAPQGILGATVDELRTRFGASVIGAEPDVRLSLPPTEWGGFGTDVDLAWASAKVETVRVSIPYWQAPSAKDAQKALFDKKWGAPRDGTFEGHAALIYRDKEPTVVVSDTGRASVLVISSVPYASK